MAVNYDKKEFVDPWKIHGIAKLVEWCGNPQAGVFPFLLRKSSDGGGGDYPGAARYAEYCGRWAGDRVALIGDYDESNLWEQLDPDNEASEWTDISLGLLEEYNEFMGKPFALTGDASSRPLMAPDMLISLGGGD